MSITFACTCGKSFRLKDEHAGRKAKCPQCGEDLTVPAAGPADTPAQPVAQETGASIAFPCTCAGGQANQAQASKLSCKNSSYSVIGGDGKAYGPVDEVGMSQWVREGRINSATSIRCEPEGQIVQAASLPFLAPSFSAPAMTVMQYSPYGQIIPAGSPQASMHAFAQFPGALVVILGLLTLNIFFTIWFNLMHGKMPKIRHDDPSAGKAIGFMFIPFFNFYWVFFTFGRLVTRIDEQRTLRGLPPTGLKGLAITICVLIFVPYLGALVNWLILIPIFGGLMQGKINELVKVSAR